MSFILGGLLLLLLLVLLEGRVMAQQVRVIGGRRVGLSMGVVVGELGGRGEVAVLT